MSDGFRFEEDLAGAATLPSSWYVDPAVLALTFANDVSKR